MADQVQVSTIKEQSATVHDTHSILVLRRVINYPTNIYGSSVIYAIVRLMPCHELSYEHIRQFWDTTR